MIKRLFIILTVLGLTSSCFADSELMSYTKQKFLGLNTRVNEKLLQDDEAADASNITLDNIGAIQDRDVFGQYNSSSGILGNNPLTGLFKYYTNTSKYFLACAGSKVALGSGGAFSSDISPTTNTVVPGTYWSAVTFNNLEYLFNPSVPMQKYSGMGGVNAPGSVPTTNCAFSAVHKARVWAARADSTPYRIYYCSLKNADDWTTTGGSIDLPDISQVITGIVSWGGYLHVFTENKIYILLGSTPNDFSLRNSSSIVGAVAPRSIRISDIGIIFLSRTGVFAFDGNTSHKLSDKIESLINDISKTLIQNACGIYDGQNKYWLAYTEQGATYNNKILIYDTILKEWYPYDNLNISCFERAYGGTDRGELYGGSSTSNGLVLQLQSSTGTESITHSTESDFLNNVTFNTVATQNPSVIIPNNYTVDNYTKFLCHFDGVDGSVIFTDETGKSITAVGNAYINTAKRKFGSASGNFDGINSYIRTPPGSDWDLGSDNFTIECWVNFSSLQTSTFYNQATNANKFAAFAYSNAGNKLTFYDYDSAFNIKQECSWTPSINTWYHIAVTRNGLTDADWKIFINGISQTLTTQTGSGNPVNPQTSVVEIGVFTNIISFDDYFPGNIDEYRFSKGIARWTSNFIPITPISMGTLTSRNIQINTAGQTSLDRVSWTDNLPTNTKITVQTRTGPTDDTVAFANWQYWSSQNTVTLATVTDATTMFKQNGNIRIQIPSVAQTRNISYYEDEDSVSPKSAQFQVFGAASTNAYADGYLTYTDLSNYDWLTIWYKSPASGNSVEFYMSNTGNTLSDNYVTFNTVIPNSWEKAYWYIGNIPDDQKSGIKYIRVKYKGDVAGYAYIGEVDAHNYYSSSDIISSTPDDWIQYRTIFGTNDAYYTPELLSITLSYTPTSGNQESSLSTFYTTKFINFGSPQVDKQFLDFFADVYTDTDSDLQPFYFDYDIDNGKKTGIITIASSNTVTDNSVRIKKYFPSNTFGKTMELTYRNPNAKTSKKTIQNVEIRYRPEKMN